MSVSERDQFINKLIYFGGNLGIQAPIKDYVDVEEFIIEATKYYDTDSRVKQTFLNWLHLFAPYISPSKIRRILKIKDFESKSLSIFVSILENHPLNSQNWEILKPFCLERPSYKFKSNYSKYLKTTKYILRNCPELKFKVQGLSPVLSDLKAYLSKNKKFKSLYQIAKETFNPKNRINYEFELLQYIQI